MLERDDDRPLRVEAGDEHRLVDGLAPAREEPHPSRPAVGPEKLVDEELRQHGLVVVPQARVGGEMAVAIERVLDRLDNSWMPVPEIAAAVWLAKSSIRVPSPRVNSMPSAAITCTKRYSSGVTCSCR